MRLMSNDVCKGPCHLNQLGGAYVNGKPLPKEIRHEIISLALQGLRPCDISRRLRITHGCISKLLSKYRKTGSIQPGGEGVGRPRVITPLIAQRIEQLAKQQPGLYSWEIRDRLVQENICSRENIPSLSSISRLLKRKGNQETASEGSQQTSSNSYTIASILNLPSNCESSSSTSSSVCSFSSLDSNEGRTDDHKHTEHVPNLEDLHDESSAEVIYPLQTQRRERIKYNSQQMRELEAAFAVNRYPSATERDQLATKIGVTESRIQVWFSNRRVKCKTRRHTVHEAGLSTFESKECTCRRHSDSQISPQMMTLGPSKIFFPSSHT